MTSLNNALVIHAVAAPVIFGVLAASYFKHFGFTTPVQTATLFVLFVILMDVVVVGWLVEQSFAMFRSLLGTWIPFLLIFLATLVAGWLAQAGPGRPLRPNPGRH